MSNYVISNALDADGETALDELVNNTVKLTGEQTITGKKTFNEVVINDLVVNTETSFSTEDGIIEQLKGNTGDLLDYGNYATYNDGSEKYKGVINKAGTDKFYVFHNQTNEPETSLNLNTQSLGTLVVRNPTENNEVATKEYVDNNSGGGGGSDKLSLSGGTMTGDINMNDNSIVGVDDFRLSNNHGRLFSFGGDTFLQASGETNRFHIGRLGSTVKTITVEAGTRKIDFFGELDMNGNRISKVNGMDFEFSSGEDLVIRNDFNPSTSQGGTWIEADNRLFFGKANIPTSFHTCEMNMSSRQTSFQGEVSIGNNKITGVANPTNGTDAANKAYVDSVAGGGGGGGAHLPLSGGTMTGAINMGSNKITNLGQPTDNGDAVTKLYLENQLDSAPFLPLTGGSVTGNVIFENNSRIFFDDSNTISIFGSGGDILLSRGVGQNKFMSVNNTEVEMRNLNINMGSNRIQNLTGGVNNGDAVNVAQLNTKLSLFGGTMNADINMNGNTTTNLKAPVNSLDAATKLYVDQQISAAVQGLLNNQVAGKVDNNTFLNEVSRIDTLINDIENDINNIIQNPP